jgi:hypothetical protein
LSLRAERKLHLNAVTAACYLGRGRCFATADHLGQVLFWEDLEVLGSSRLEGDAIRTIALHQEQPLLLVGGKIDSRGHPLGLERPGFLVGLELE